MLYKLSPQWECNGYHDSDWYVVAYNTETNKVEKTCVGTTRGYMTPPPIYEPTQEILKLAQACLFEIINERFSNQWKELSFNAGMYPVEVGEHLLVKRSVSTGLRKPCVKCSQTGQWVNPSNKSDIRICFSCSGRKFTTRPLRSSDGKPVKVSIKKGTLAEVLHREVVPDQYGRSTFDKYYLWCKTDAHDHPIRININSMTRPWDRACQLAVAEDADNIARSRAFIKWLA